MNMFDICFQKQLSHVTELFSNREHVAFLSLGETNPENPIENLWTMLETRICVKKATNLNDFY